MFPLLPDQVESAEWKEISEVHKCLVLILLIDRDNQLSSNSISRADIAIYFCFFLFSLMDSLEVYFSAAISVLIAMIEMMACDLFQFS